MLSLGSAFTTVLGARQILPSPLAESLGLLVQTMLFLILAGATARHAPARKWIVAFIFAGLSIYTSFFAYYGQLAGDAVEAAGKDRARQAHAAFVAGVYPPLQQQLSGLQSEARSWGDLAEREAGSGLTTGQRGFGPVAREYAMKARDAEMEAASFGGELARISPRFAMDTAEWSPEQLYAWDLETWQMLPAEWKAGAEEADGAPMVGPLPEVYLDLEHEIALLAPWYKVRAGEDAALVAILVAILLAALVDGVCLLLGTAIHRREERLVDSVSSEAAALIGAGRAAGARMRAAWERPSEVERREADSAVAGLHDPLRRPRLGSPTSSTACSPRSPRWRPWA